MKGKLKITKFVYDAAFAKSSVYVVPVAQKLLLFSAKIQPNTVKTNQHCTRKNQVIIRPSIKNILFVIQTLQGIKLSYCWKNRMRGKI